MTDHAVSQSQEGVHPSPHRNRVSAAALFFGLFGGAAAWSLQELSMTAFNSHACYPQDVPLRTPFIAHVSLILAVIGIVAIVIALAAVAVSVRNWRATREEKGGGHHTLLDTGDGRTRFMALAGALVSGVFFFNCVLNAAALLFVTSCG